MFPPGIEHGSFKAQQTILLAMFHLRFKAAFNPKYFSTHSDCPVTNYFFFICYLYISVLEITATKAELKTLKTFMVYVCKSYKLFCLTTISNTHLLKHTQLKQQSEQHTRCTYNAIWRLPVTIETQQHVLSFTYIQL